MNNYIYSNIDEDTNSMQKLKAYNYLRNEKQSNNKVLTNMISRISIKQSALKEQFNGCPIIHHSLECIFVNKYC